MQESVELQHSLPLSPDPIFVLDGRIVSFPEGLKTNEYTHTMHRFPGKFVPQVARELILLTGVSPASGRICDPFCGSGTTLVEAAAMGINSVGVDFDPLGALIARVKTTALSTDELDVLSQYWRDDIPDHPGTLSIPDIENLSHWFTPRATAQISYIKSRCLQLPARLRAFSLVVMSSILRRVSNADDQTQKTYVSGTLPKTPPLPSHLFPLFLARAIEGMKHFSETSRATPCVIQGDARERFTIGKIAGIVTSPPYLDSIDYVYNQMLEYYWLHEELGLADVIDIRKLRSKPMGFVRGDIASALDHIAETSPFLSSKLEPDLTSISLTSKKEAEHVAGYFRDFTDHLAAARCSIDSGTRYVMSVGESVVRGRLINTPDHLVTLFEAKGFRLIGRCSYVIKRHYMKFPRRSNSGTIKMDHILCFEAE